jgi:uncharacterized protein YndB with AHSA1/START domain
MAANSPADDDVFRALADPTRRRLLDALNARNGLTLRELCVDADMARQSMSKHLAVLEAAQLVSTIRRGREKRHYLNPAPINGIAERWISQYHRRRVIALSALKHALEEETMDAPSFVYTTYIRTTPERLWRALTEPAFTERYWGLTIESDWQEGSPYAVLQWGLRIEDVEQVVLESRPYERLSYTWHTFTPEWRAEAQARVGFPAEYLERIAAERRSRATFEIADLGEMVKLTVIHDRFDADSDVLPTISQGWPHILSNLKTLLETDEVLPVPAAPAGQASATG